MLGKIAGRRRTTQDEMDWVTVTNSNGHEFENSEDNEGQEGSLLTVHGSQKAGLTGSRSSSKVLRVETTLTETLASKVFLY